MMNNELKRKIRTADYYDKRRVDRIFNILARNRIVIDDLEDESLASVDDSMKEHIEELKILSNKMGFMITTRIAHSQDWHSIDSAYVAIIEKTKQYGSDPRVVQMHEPGIWEPIGSLDFKIKEDYIAQKLMVMVKLSGGQAFSRNKSIEEYESDLKYFNDGKNHLAASSYNDLSSACDAVMAFFDGCYQRGLLTIKDLEAYEEYQTLVIGSTKNKTENAIPESQIEENDNRFLLF